MKTRLSQIQGGNSLDNTTESVNTCYRNLPVRQARGLYRRELTPEIVARFSSKYNKSRGCWPWQAGTFAKGYGMFNIRRDEYGKQHTEYAHRIAYVLAKGDIPPGLVVRHTCDNPPCCNPDHLLLGTQADNINDAAVQGHYSVPRPSIQKITDAQVRDIRESSEAGVALAERYGVTPSCISQLRHGKRRKVAA